MSKIIAIWHHKGGVGKSTLTHNLGCHLAIAGKTTLLVGMNSQATLERFCGVPDPDQLTQTIAHAIERVIKGESADPPIYEMGGIMAEIKPNLPRAVRDWADAIAENLYLSPCNYYLNTVELILTGVDLREFRLTETLEPLQGQFDYILIDCPGEGNLSTTMSLVASTHILVPLQTAKTSYDNLPLTLRKVQAMQRVNRDLKFAGFVPTMFDSRRTHDNEVMREIQSLSQTASILPPLKESVAFRDAAGVYCPLILYDRNHESVKALQTITKHILKLK